MPNLEQPARQASKARNYIKLFFYGLIALTLPVTLLIVGFVVVFNNNANTSYKASELAQQKFIEQLIIPPGYVRGEISHDDYPSGFGDLSKLVIDIKVPPGKTRSQVVADLRVANPSLNVGISKVEPQYLNNFSLSRETVQQEQLDKLTASVLLRPYNMPDESQPDQPVKSLQLSVSG